MTIKVRCGGCGKIYQVSDEAAGRKMRCKACDTIVRVPEPEPAEEMDPWEVEEEFAEQPFEAAPQPVRPSRGANKPKRRPAKSEGLSTGQKVAIGIGTGFFVMLLICGGLVYKIVSDAKQFVQEIQKDIEEEIAKEEARREQRATALKSAPLVPLDLSETGLPLVIDVPEGTTIDWTKDPDGLGENEKRLEVSFVFEDEHLFQLRRRVEFHNVDEFKNHLTRSWGISPNQIEVLENKVVIYRLADDMDLYEIWGIATIDEEVLEFPNDFGDSFKRDEVDLLARCFLSLRKKDQPAGDTPAQEEPGEK